MKWKNPSVFNLATCITISRFILVPIFIHYFLIRNFKMAVLILLIASITDVTDGLLARRFNMATKLGTVLDPLADKFLMLVSFLVLSASTIQPGNQKIIPVWLACVVIGRDFYIIFGMIYLYFVRNLNVLPKPTILSKRTTFFQFVLLTFSFLKVYIIVKQPAMGSLYTNLILHTQSVLIYVVCALTIATFFQYTHLGIQTLKQGEKRPL